MTGTLSPAETRDLQRLLGIMIPASGEYGIPAANDPIIFADILASLGRDLAEVRTALDELATFAGGPFAGLDEARAAAVAGLFLASDSHAVGVLGRHILLCYYRDDRVLRSLGQEPRAPFPQGHVVEQGDWSLLEAVKGRPQLWRDDRS
ncbi:MAG TPA: hypothetical protein VGG57_08385 [Stellaceae bacterium]